MDLLTKINENGIELPQCIIYHTVLANASLKPNKLLRRLKTNHSKCKNKYTYF